jgi:hypothetical protein
MKKRDFLIVSLPGIVACTAPTTEQEEAPVVETNGAEEQQIITFQGWTAEALKPVEVSDDPVRIRAQAKFVGTGVKPAGVCALRQFTKAGGVTTPCTTVADCASSPTNLETGGYRYCTSANGGASKTCYYRPGTQQRYCAGTPATGTPIGPGTYQTSLAGGPGRWISYACFAGCATSDPSSSSSVLLTKVPDDDKGNK